MGVAPLFLKEGQHPYLRTPERSGQGTRTGLHNTT